MSTELTVTLREVAEKLATGRKKIDDAALLSLLQAGDLAAGFYFPGASPTWVQIPTSYWQKIGSDRFELVRKTEGNDRRTGTFKVRIADFVGTYVEQVVERLKQRQSDELADLRDELTAVINNATSQYEVRIF